MAKAKRKHTQSTNDMRAVTRMKFSPWNAPPADIRSGKRKMFTDEVITDRMGVATLAYGVMTKTKRQLVAYCARDEEAERVLRHFVENLPAYAEDFEGLARMIRGAHARLLIAFTVLASREAKRGRK